MAVVLACPSAVAALGDQFAKLTANDGAEADLFAISVGINGTMAIVGAYWDDDHGINSGSAYVFDISTGSQLAKLVPSDGEAHDYFGVSVGISGTKAIVGAYRDDDRGNDSGSAYVFDIRSGAQLAKLTPTDGAADDLFGSSVAISGNTAVVGALADDDNGSGSGSAYLFDVTTGRQVTKLIPNDGRPSDYFGSSVGVGNETVLVGAPGDDDNGTSSGTAYLFDNLTGAQLLKFAPTDGASSQRFGYSVGLSGNISIVGAPGDDENGTSSGGAYLFDNTTGAQLLKFTPTDGASGQQFGYSVGVSGNTTIVGAPGYDGNHFESGGAYLFDVTTGAELAKLTPSDRAASDQFGSSVGAGGNTVIVGAWGDNNNGVWSGSAYLFDATIPEPSTLLLAAWVSVGALAWRRR